MFERGLSYSSICTARSALNNFVSLPGYSDISEHNLIKRFIKGCFNMRPPQLRYAHTWDINQVLQYIHQMGQNFELNSKQLSLKLVMLLTLLNIQRVETIPSFNTEKMFLDETSCTFLPDNLLKHSRPSYANKPVTYRAYPHNPNLCPVTAIKHYKSIRDLLFPNTPQFIVTHRKPHKAAHKDTIARWVKELMREAGVDTSIFKAHSCHSASASAAKNIGIPIEDILRKANWSNANTFLQFYYRELGDSVPQVSIDLGTALLRRTESLNL